MCEYKNIFIIYLLWVLIQTEPNFVLLYFHMKLSMLKADTLNVIILDFVPGTISIYPALQPSAEDSFIKMRKVKTDE